MKKLIFILSFVLMSVLYVTAANNETSVISNDKTKIENVSVIKMCVPGIVKIFPSQETNFVKINGADSILLKNIIYEIQDSVLNIKLKHGSYEEWRITDNKLRFFIGVNSDDPTIITSNDLILSNNKTRNKFSESNHAKQNN